MAAAGEVKDALVFVILDRHVVGSYMTFRLSTVDEMRAFLATVNPQLAEDPPGFDWIAYRNQAQGLSSELSRRLGRTFRLSEATHIQDSTHGAEIGLPLELWRQYRSRPSSDSHQQT